MGSNMAKITGINSREDFIESISSSCPLAEDGADLRIMPELCAEALMPLLGSAAPDSFDDWNSYCCAFLLDDYYPGRDPILLKEERREAVLFYLDTLNAVFDRERRELAPCRTRDLVLLEEQEYRGYRATAEYEKLLHCLRGRYLYAFMRLHRTITPFETLGHIAGVNYVSVYIARQLLHTSVRIDPALSSGAAILHDIGKYGCRP